MLKQLLLALLLSAVRSKGVENWCSKTGRHLLYYSIGNAYDNADDAKKKCLSRSDCFGVTKEQRPGQTIWRLSKDWQLRVSKDGYTSHVPCSGYFSCDTIGLKVAGGNFLRVDGETVKANGEDYGNKETFRFRQWGPDSGFVYSESTNQLLISDPDTHELRWVEPSDNYPWYYRAIGANGLFTLYQDHDRIALQSIHGKYISAKSDGSVKADTGLKGDTEWFEVYPQSCLNNIECECPDKIDGDQYFLSNITYDSAAGNVKSYNPERVGYQYIDNADSSTEQSTTFSVSEEVTETSSFTHTAGVEVMVGTEFKCGVPTLAESKVSVEVTVAYEFSYSTEKSVTKALAAEFNCVAAPRTIVTCQALLYKYKMNVPFTQTWQHKRLPSCTCQNSGVYSEIQATEMRLIVDED